MERIANRVQANRFDSEANQLIRYATFIESDKPNKAIAQKAWVAIFSTNTDLYIVDKTPDEIRVMADEQRRLANKLRGM